MKKNLYSSYSKEHIQEIINNGPYPIRFPSLEALEQDEEWCEVLIDNKWEKVRFHDYHLVYHIPGLYETIFYRTLMCNSPNRVSALLNEALIEQGDQARDLRVLDFGAGNGMAGEALQGLGVRNIIGVDILEEAKEAVTRDRPWVYDDYKVADFTNLSKTERDFFNAYEFNALTTIAALGFGDIPPLAFYNAYNFVSNDGHIAFNLRDEIFRLKGQSKFSNLIHHMISEDIIEIELMKKYRHRLNIHGEPIYYVAIVAKKRKNIPKSFLD